MSAQYTPNFPAPQGYLALSTGDGDKSETKSSYPHANYPAAPPGPLTAPGYAGFAPQQGGYAPPGFAPQPGGYAPPGFVSQQQPPQYDQLPGHQPGHPQPGYHPPGYPQPAYQAPYQPQPGFPGHQAGPIVQQPGPQSNQPAGLWMNVPQGLSNCPPGLEYLATIDQLLVHQKVELLEAFTGFETNNKFTVKNSLGQKVYYAVEDNDCCTRNLCGPARPFEMKILDNYGNQVINMHRPLACDSCCFPCCLQSMEVSAPPGTIIGFVEQEWSILSPSYSIKNAAGDVVLRIKGPCCTFSICGDVEFNVLSKDGETKVGKITKQWSGLLREMFTDSDYFGVTFPIDLDVRMKAVLMGACFLIDVMFFEKSGNRESDRPGML